MPGRRWLQAAWSLGLCLPLLGCGSRDLTEEWAIYPLHRNEPHDGLAVVSQPDGFGLHIYLETDTRDPSVCRPRWLPDPARLFNGRGSAPFSSGLATRQEFFEAMTRDAVVASLKQELEALCRKRAPEARWQWVDPPRSEEDVTPVQLPALEEEDLLTDPYEELQRQKALLGEDTTN